MGSPLSLLQLGACLCVGFMAGAFFGALLVESQLAQLVEKAKAESFESGRKYEALQAQQRRATVGELRPKLKALP